MCPEHYVCGYTQYLCSTYVRAARDVRNWHSCQCALHAVSGYGSLGVLKHTEFNKRTKRRYSSPGPAPIRLNGEAVGAFSLADEPPLLTTAEAAARARGLCSGRCHRRRFCSARPSRTCIFFLIIIIYFNN